MKTINEDDKKARGSKCHHESDGIKHADCTHIQEFCCHEEKEKILECCCHENIIAIQNSKCTCHTAEESCHNNLEDKQCSCHIENKGDISECCCHKHETEHTTCGCSGENHEEGVCACCDLKVDYKVSQEEKRKELSKNIAILSVSLIFLIIGVLPWAKEGKFKFLPFYYVNPAWVTVIVCGWKIVYNAFKNLFKGHY